MPYKVFDYKCPKCGHLEVNHMIDEDKESPPVCMKCQYVMEKQIGTDWVRHISWGQWHIS